MLVLQGEIMINIFFCFVYFISQEKCKTLIISKICGHYLCEECWITESVSYTSDTQDE